MHGAALCSWNERRPRSTFHIWEFRSDVIVSMQKLNTHHWAGLTASMKNFFGVAPGAAYGWPKNVLRQGTHFNVVDHFEGLRPR